MLDRSHERPIPCPGFPLVLDMIIARAASRLERPAITHRGQSWCYQDLLTATFTIAEEMTAAGIRPGERVALMGPPSFGLIASFLAILRMGAVLVPISPRLTGDVLARTLASVDCTRVVSVAAENRIEGAELAILAIALDGRPAIRRTPDDLSWRARDVVLPRPLARDPAYIFFTSGTTGAHKAVLGSHAGLSHFIAWQRDTFAQAAGPICAQLTDLGFDVVLRDILFPLACGKTLAIPPCHVAEMAGAELLAWLDHERISAVHTVPSLAHHWLAEWPDDVRVDSLSCIFFAGEPLHDTLVRRLRARHESVEIINLYGPTETTLAKCFHRVPENPTPGIQPIGAPISHTQVLILGPDDRICDAGQAGEIVIRTPFRSLGYVGHAASESPDTEASARFRTSPFTDDPDDILYWTGDRGLVDAHGVLWILGRRDHQVKIRGQRVHPDGVAAELSRHPDIAHAAVVAVHAAPGDERLVAFVVTGPQAAVTVDGMRSFLGERVPTYMVPAAFHIVDALPRTPRGKLDRRALEECAVDLDWNIAHEATYEAPGTALERLIASIWAELLSAGTIGRNDDFFALGGNSLLATRMLSRLARSHAPPRLGEFFQEPTVAGLATLTQCIARRSHVPPAAEKRYPPTPMLRAYLRGDPDAEGMDPCWNMLAQHDVRGRFDLAAFRAAAADLVLRHEALRSRIVRTDDEFHFEVCAAAPPALEFHDLSSDDVPQQAPKLAALTAALRARVFSYTEPRRVRFTVLARGQDLTTIISCVDLLVCDLQSMAVLQRDLWTLYMARTGDSPVSSSALASAPQFGEFTRQLRDQAELDQTRNERYLSRLRDHVRAMSPLAIDVRAGAPRTARLVLPEPVHASLRKSAREHGTTTFIVMLAGVHILRWLREGGSRSCVNTILAGRDDVRSLDAIGCFIRTFPIFISNLSPDTSVHDVLRRSIEVFTETRAHQSADVEGTLLGLGRTDVLREYELNYHHRHQRNVPMDPDLVVVPREPLAEADHPYYWALMVEDTGGELVLDLAGRDRYLRGDEANRSLADYQSVLTTLVTSPRTTLGRLAARRDLESASA